MFLFVGGITPRTVSSEVYSECPRCGSETLQERRIDQVLSLFFIPLFTVHAGRPFNVCTSCRWDSRYPELQTSREHPGLSSLPTPYQEAVGVRSDHAAPSAPELPLSCSQCGNPIQSNFLFCPFCGTFLKEE
jgi:hypothetical protein